MAMVYSPPDEFDDPPDLADYVGPEMVQAGDYFEACQQWTDRLAEWCRANTDVEDELIGHVYTSPVADGKAMYMVCEVRPLTLIHLPLGDAWTLPPPHERGLTVSDVRKHKKFEDVWRKEAKKKKT